MVLLKCTAPYFIYYIIMSYFTVNIVPQCLIKLHKSLRLRQKYFSGRDPTDHWAGLCLVDEVWLVRGRDLSQFGLVHAAHDFLQFNGHCHVAFDPQFPRHEGRRRLQLP